MPSWTNPTTGNWSDASKWTGGVANGAGAIADFTVTSGGSGTPFILFAQNDLFTVGTLNIFTDSDDGWLFRGDVGVTNATLRFQGSGGGPAFLNIDTNGSSRATTIGTFNLSVNLASDLILNTINSDTTLILSANVTGSRDLYKFGDGVLSLSGSNASWTGDLLLRGGRTELGSGSAPTGGTIEFDNGGALVADGNFTISNTIETRGGNSQGVIAAMTGNSLTLTGLLRVRSDNGAAITFGTAADQGTVTLSGTSSIDANGGFNIAGGTVRFGTAGAAANFFTGLSSLGLVQIATGGTLDTRGFATTLANLDFDGGTLTSSTGVLNVTVNDSTVAGNTQSGTVIGTAGADKIVVNVNDLFTFASATFNSWTNGTDTITLIGNGADNTISGSTQNDTINGGGGADLLIGNGGNDVIDGGTGADELQGGQGNDAYIVDNPGDVVIESAAQGTDLVFTSINYTLTNEVERLSVNGSTTTFAINLTGNALANEITGNNGVNIIDGGGNADIMSGLGGSDSYFVDNAGDVVVELLNQGTDTIFTSVNFTLDHDIENLSVNGLGTTNAINLTGNELVNLITGNNGANVIDGKAGADTMSGLGGDDIYFVDVAGDVIIEGSGGGFDTVFTIFNYTLSDDIERVAVNGATTTFAIDLTGNARANEISGNDGSNVLAGQGGSDILIGNGGSDIFAFTSSIFAGSIDQILDFQVGIDKIGLDDGEFAGLSVGLLPAGAFRVGSSAQDADDRIIYNSATGALFFDADGNGAGAAVQFANLSNGLALTASDFQVI